MPLRFVWGVRAVDQGDYLNPASTGRLDLDYTFNMSSGEAQMWLLQFCKDVRKQPFYEASSSFAGLMPNCFLEQFYEFMSRR